MKENYGKLCEEQIGKMTIDGKTPTLLLHSCCGPCSSYVLEFLSRYFEITVLFYNPNIYPEEEFKRRLETQNKIITKMGFPNDVKLITLTDEYGLFLEKVTGLENEIEGGKRCVECFRMRLEKTAAEAKRLGFDCFTTTLSVSPHKNAEVLNAIGKEMSQKYEISYLFSDFKKKEGYKRSIELSKQYGLYRQEYCGCEFSLINR